MDLISLIYNPNENNEIISSQNISASTVGWSVIKSIIKPFCALLEIDHAPIKYIALFLKSKFINYFFFLFSKMQSIQTNILTCRTRISRPYL